MAIKTRTEFMDSLKSLLADNTSDEALAIIEDASDTLTDMETRATDETDWKTKYEQNDEAWRKKYKERFFSGKSAPEDDEIEPTDDRPKRLSFEELFK